MINSTVHDGIVFTCDVDAAAPNAIPSAITWMRLRKKGKVHLRLSKAMLRCINLKNIDLQRVLLVPASR